MKRIASIAVALLALSAADSSPAAITGLVGQWHFDEGSGLTVADSSPYSNNGTVQGTTPWVPGRAGTALSFDGVTSRVAVADNAALEPPQAVTVSAWIKNGGSPGGYRYIVAKGVTGCTAAAYGLYSGPSGGLYFYVSMTRGTAFVRSPDAGTRVWDGRWHLAVGTFDGSTVRLYVDGAEVGSGTPRPGPLEYLLPDSNDLFVGDYPGCQDHNFRGTIDEVSIYSAALTATQVRALFEDSSGQSSSGGSGQPTTTLPNGGTGSAGSGTRIALPILGRLRVSPSAFALSIRGGHSRARKTGTTISYTDTQWATTNFLVLRRQAGVAVQGLCIPKPKRASGRRKSGRPCVAYTPVGTVKHADRPGRNSFHFAGLRGRRLTPGVYRLEATPRTRQQTGLMVSAQFTVIK
jgi:hypothetical protein